MHTQGTPRLNTSTRCKFDASIAVLSLGVDVLFVDAHTVWCSPDTALAIAENAQGHIALRHAAVRKHVFNTGVYYAHSCEESTRFLQAARSFPAITGQHAANN